MLHKIRNICNLINQKIGQTTSWLAVIMVIMMSLNVFMRYLFAMGDPWQQELVRFMHAMLFLLATGYAFQLEQHVRVDVLYQNMSIYTKAKVNLIGSLIFLFPTAISLIYFSYGYVIKSWSIFEGSSEYLGMPGVFLLKSCIWVCGGVLIIHGISIICRSVLILRNDKQTIAELKQEEEDREKEQLGLEAKT